MESVKCVDRPMSGAAGRLVGGTVFLAMVLASGEMSVSLGTDIYVDPVRGRDMKGYGETQSQPFRSISAAVAVIPEHVQAPITIHLRPGCYRTTGGHGMPDNHLVLRRRTAPGCYIQLEGAGDENVSKRPVLLDWLGAPMVTVCQGRWRIEHVQLGNRDKKQREGFVAQGSESLLDLVDVRIRTASHSGSGIQAERSGRIHLYGTIELNEDLHDECKDLETFSRIMATDHGRVKFMQSKGASLSIGNGGLGASYYGTVRLGCEAANVTSWAKSHPLAIGNSGRIDLGGTDTQLSSMNPDGILVAAEDDGHILAENTHVVLQAGSEGNASAICLQKASTLFGGPFDIRGRFRGTIVTMSGSTFVGQVVGNLGSADAYTGAHLCLQNGSGLPTRVAHARSGATIVLPTGEVLRERVWTPQQ
jgi:hypothetical protein